MLFNETAQIDVKLLRFTPISSSHSSGLINEVRVERSSVFGCFNDSTRVKILSLGVLANHGENKKMSAPFLTVAQISKIQDHGSVSTTMKFFGTIILFASTT